MRVSVIVVSYRSPATLARCLDALLADEAAAEIVVADCSPEPPPIPNDPRVRLLHHARAMTVPKLRWSALSWTTGDVIAATEARMIPCVGWASRLGAAHAKHAAPAIGGAVDFEGTSLFDRGLYWAEYGRFAPPITEGPSNDLSGANLSFKRAALDGLETSQWETHLFARWRRAGTPPHLIDAPVMFVNGMSRARAFRQRFDYGRGFAAARVSGVKRIAYAALSPALPVVLTARHVSAAVRRGRFGDLLPSLGWTAALETAWSAGEAVGYLAGPPRKDVIY